MKRHPGQMTWTLLIAALLAAGCAGPQATGLEGPHPRWPRGPAPARIAHYRDITGPAAIARPSFFQSLGRLIAGERPQVLLQPSSIAVAGDMVAISDQERQAVHVMDFAGRHSELITRVGDVYLTSPVGVAICKSEIAIADSALKKVYLVTGKGKLRRTLDHAFERPTGLAYDAGQGSLYVVDTLKHEVLEFGLDGALRKRFGGRGSGIDEFNFPTHICVDGKGRVYVTDSLNFRVKCFTREGQFLFEIGRHGDATGHMGVPKGVAVDSFGHIYVVDSYFCTVQIFNDDGDFLLNFGAPGAERGQFQVPAGLAIDEKNRIFVCDSFNHRIQVFEYLEGADHDTLPAAAAASDADR